MKIKTKTFKKLFQKTFHKKRGELINPLKAWTTGLITAVIVFMLGAAFTVFDFYSQLVSPKEIVIIEKPLEYKAQEVQEYAEFYNQKAQNFNETRGVLRQAVPPPPEESTEEDTEEEETVAEEPVGE